ncbi:MAG: hypothetical protein H7287_11500, partial [Thermoleophilia bacterium]|nr:hypothetical protein [Thermoleophilia bacterium]
GLMDESFFMYGEEVEWLRRLARLGRRVAWEPGAIVTHVGGGSARREWGRMYQLQLANHVRYMALAEGAVAARRTQRLLVRALRVRARVWGWLGRRERAAAFAEGAATVAAIDPTHVGERQVPTWPALQRDGVNPR